MVAATPKQLGTFREQCTVWVLKYYARYFGAQVHLFFLLGASGSVTLYYSVQHTVYLVTTLLLDIDKAWRVRMCWLLMGDSEEV